MRVLRIERCQPLSLSLSLALALTLALSLTLTLTLTPTQAVVIDLSFIIEGTCEAELPERLLCALRLHRINLNRHWAKVASMDLSRYLSTDAYAS